MKNTTAALVFASAALVLAGCDSRRSLTEVMMYGKDQKTGLCFVGQDWNNDQSIDGDKGISNVPCTPEVLREIQLKGDRG